MAQVQYPLLCLLVLGLMEVEMTDIAYTLALQWPASFCSTLKAKQTCIDPTPNHWTIHGLWPKKTYCREQFDSESISESTRVMLEKFWPNLNASSNNSQFWAYQWQKHGSCTDMTIEDYFARAITLAKTFDISKILQKNSVIPSNEITYTDKHLSECIQTVSGHRSKVKSTTHEPYLLTEIRICYDKTFRVIDCVANFTDKQLLYLIPKNPTRGHGSSAKDTGNLLLILLFGVLIPVIFISLTIAYFKLSSKPKRLPFTEYEQIHVGKQN